MGHEDRYALVPKGTMLQVVSTADVRGLKKDGKTLVYTTTKADYRKDMF